MPMAVTLQPSGREIGLGWAEDIPPGFKLCLRRYYPPASSTNAEATRSPLRLVDK